MPIQPDQTLIDSVRGTQAMTARVTALRDDWTKFSYTFPACAGAVDCTKAINRGADGLFWLPPGSFTTPYGFIFNINQIKSLSGTTTTVFYDPPADINSNSYATNIAVTDGLYKQFRKYFSITLSASGTGNKSLNDFIKANPNFALEYTDFRSSVTPTPEELNNVKGAKKFYDRGGTLIYKPLLDGQVSLHSFGIDVCGQFCRGCVTDYYPYGAPTCSKRLIVETKGFDWGMFLQRRFVSGSQYVTTPNSNPVWLVSIKRLPKSTWDKIDDGIETVLGPLKDLANWVCEESNSPEGQMARSYAKNAKDPYTKASALISDQVLSNACAAPTVDNSVENVIWTPKAPAPPKAVKDSSALFQQLFAALPTAPTQPKYPAGSIARAIPKLGKFEIAVPLGLAGLQPTHKVVATISMGDKPLDVPAVNLVAWDRATKPWYQRTAFYAASGLGVAAVAGLVWKLRKRKH